jgi:hypothetical protein
MMWLVCALAEAFREASVRAVGYVMRRESGVLHVWCQGRKG